MSTPASSGRMAGELVNDMLGLGPLEPLLEDDSIADIMVNGPNRVFIERGGKDRPVRRAVPRHGPSRRHLPADRIGGRPPGGRIEPNGRCTAAGRFARQHRLPATRARRPLPVDPQVRQEADRFREADRFGALTPPGRGDPESRGAGPVQHHHLRRHRFGKDDPAQRALAADRPGRARHHGRGRGRVAIAAAACRPAGNPAAQHRRQRRGNAARPGPQRAPHAARPDHHRRSPRRARRSTCCRP